MPASAAVTRERRPSVLDLARPALEASGLRKSYRGLDHRDRLVVDDVSFALQPGTTLVVGESGSGKSTTARLVLGLTTPDAGAVRLGGLAWNGVGVRPRRALDVSIQAQVLDLLADLQADRGLAYLFISHDLGVVHHVSDEVLVMSQGRVVERGPADRVLRAPADPYTRQLVASVPRLAVATST